MNDLVGHVAASIQHHRLIQPGKPILVAVSGGLDSMVLLHVLQQLTSGQRWKLRVAHFNHQLRGADSDADEQLVRRTAQRLGWPCLTERAEVRAVAREQKLSLEMAARRLRHEGLARMAGRSKSKVIALAHHADDQVELYFLRLLRGAGCEGLAGMKWRNPSPADRRISLVRPLLDQDKETLRAFAVQHQIPFREDTSNASLAMQRNRLRHELLPLLRTHYQPALNRVILRTMEMQADVADFVHTAAQQHCKTPGDFARLHPAVQRAMLQQQLQKLALSVDYDLVERLRQNADKRITPAPNLELWRDKAGRIHVRRRTVPSFEEASVELELAAKTHRVVFGGVTLAWKFLSGAARPAPRAGTECFDADQVGPRICLRHWRRGDRFQPIGMSQPLKLQDWFTNQKIPREQRHQLIIATTANGEIFWVEDQRIADKFKLGATTRRQLRWTWTAV